MRKKDSLFSQRITKKGVVDIRGMVSVIKDFFESNDFDWNEVRNVTKEKDKGYEVDIAFKGEKDIEDYFRREVEVEMLITRVKKVKVQDMNLDQANVEIIVRGFLISDYQNLYNSQFRSFVKTMIDKYVLTKDKKAQIGKTYTEVQELFNSIKNALGMQSS